MADDLGKLEGKPVRSTSLSLAGVNKVVGVIMNAGPRVLSSGEKVLILIEAQVGPIEFDPTLEDTAWNRGHGAVATRAAFISDASVGDLLDTYGEALAAKQDQKKGRSQLSPEVAAAAQLAADHVAGKHRRRRRDCPDCYPEDEQAASAGKAKRDRK